MAEPRKACDWEAVERDYRAGIFSIREVGRLHKLSEGAIRKKAKEQGWERDLAEKVKARTATKLVRSLGTQGGTQAQRANDDQIAEGAADVLVALVRDHRRDISNGRNVVGTLWRELQEAGENRQELEQSIESETKDDTKRRATMLRAVSLASRATVASNLAVALKNLVGIERQAFGLENGLPPSEEQTDHSITVRFVKSGGTEKA